MFIPYFWYVGTLVYWGNYGTKIACEGFIHWAEKSINADAYAA